MFTAFAENQGNMIRVGQLQPPDHSLLFLLLVSLILLLVLSVLIQACCA